MRRMELRTTPLSVATLSEDRMFTEAIPGPCDPPPPFELLIYAQAEAAPPCNRVPMEGTSAWVQLRAGLVVQAGAGLTAPAPGTHSVAHPRWVDEPRQR